MANLKKVIVLLVIIGTLLTACGDEKIVATTVASATPSSTTSQPIVSKPTSTTMPSATTQAVTNIPTTSQSVVSNPTLLATTQAVANNPSIALDKNGLLLLTFSPDNKSLIGVTKKSVVFWDAITGIVQSTMTFNALLPTISLTQDGKNLAVVTVTGCSFCTNMEIYDINNKKLLDKFEAPPSRSGETGRVTASVLLSDNKTAVGGGDYGNIKIWDYDRGREIAVLKLPSSLPQAEVKNIWVSEDGITMTSANSNGTIITWNLNTKTLVNVNSLPADEAVEFRSAIDPNSSTEFFYSPNNQLVAKTNVFYKEPGVKIYDVTSKKW